MNLPNKLTLFRCILTPAFLAVMMIPFPYHYTVALALFGLASITDYLDGQIARKQNLVTNLGKFLDPLADKALTTAAYIGFLAVIPSRSLPWAVFLVLAREFAVTSVRLMAAKDGVVVAASWSGKAKTVLQMVSVLYMLTFLQLTQLDFFHNLPGFVKLGGYAGMGLIWLAVLATVVSGIQYVWELRHYFKETTD